MLPTAEVTPEVVHGRGCAPSSQFTILKNDTQEKSTDKVEIKSNVDSFFQNMHAVGSTLEQGTLRSQNLKKCAKFTEFVATHHRKATQFTFRIESAPESSVDTFKTTPNPPDVLVGLHLLPCPVLTSGHSYKSFQTCTKLSPHTRIDLHGGGVVVTKPLIKSP